MRTVIIHGKRVSVLSPRHGRPECELWGVTRANPKFWSGALKDWTRWFDMHPLVAAGQFPGIADRRPEAWHWYQKQDATRPIYLQAPRAHPVHAQEQAARRFAEIPGAVEFPLDQVLAAFPILDDGDGWYICMVGMMMAYALVEGFEHIILNGIGTNPRIDFQHLHRDTLYWIGLARGRGVRVTIEGPSTYHTPAQVYAYEVLHYEELARARREMTGPTMADMDEAITRDLKRGRPVRKFYA